MGLHGHPGALGDGLRQRGQDGIDGGPDLGLGDERQVIHRQLVEILVPGRVDAVGDELLAVGEDLDRPALHLPERVRRPVRYTSSLRGRHTQHSVEDAVGLGAEGLVVQVDIDRSDVAADDAYAVVRPGAPHPDDAGGDGRGLVALPAKRLPPPAPIDAAGPLFARGDRDDPEAAVQQLLAVVGHVGRPRISLSVRQQFLHSRWGTTMPSSKARAAVSRARAREEARRGGNSIGAHRAHHRPVQPCRMSQRLRSRRVL
jgi:hypothetical protein